VYPAVRGATVLGRELGRFKKGGVGIQDMVGVRGMRYPVDERGSRTAVVSDLEEWRDIWEDLCDALVSELRKGEPSVPWETLKGDVTDEAATKDNV